MDVKRDTLSGLALHGGPKAIASPLPDRGLMGREEIEAVNKLLEDAVRTGKAVGYNGEEEMAYCREFADFMGGGYTDAVNSGTSAVYVALKALNLEPFSEVVVGAITDPGGIMPIVLQNCIPFVADTAPGSCNVGVDQIRECLTPFTRAIVVAHIFGEPADMDG